MTALLFACLGAGARVPDKLHLGADWGFTATALRFHHYNYLDESIGFRVDDSGWTSDIGANGFVYLTVGFDVTDRLKLDAYAGYAGVNDNVRIVPVLVGATWFLRSGGVDGFFLYARGGEGFKPRKSGPPIIMGTAGPGFRLALSRRSSIDVKLGIQFSIDHPEVWDPVERQYISPHNIRRNDATYYGVNLGIALNL